MCTGGSLVWPVVRAPARGAPETTGLLALGLRQAALSLALLVFSWSCPTGASRFSFSRPWGRCCVGFRPRRFRAPGASSRVSKRETRGARFRVAWAAKLGRLFGPDFRGRFGRLGARFFLPRFGARFVFVITLLGGDRSFWLVGYQFFPIASLPLAGALWRAFWRLFLPVTRLPGGFRRFRREAGT